MNHILSRKLNLHIFAIATALIMSPLTVSSVFAQATVAVPEAVLSSALLDCASPVTCGVAMQSMINQLAAANPDADLAVIIASVISAVAAGYNAGTIPAAAAQVAISSAGSIAASSGYTKLASVAVAASMAVASGDPVNVEAVAEASGSPA